MVSSQLGESSKKPTNIPIICFSQEKVGLDHEKGQIPLLFKDI